MSRVAIDVIWSGAKPVAVVGYYTLFGLALSLYFLKQGKASGLLISLVVFLFPVTLLASQLNSAVPLFEHMKFALQVFIPCLFLVAVTNIPRLMYQTSVTYKKYFSFGALFLLMVASYISYMQESLPGESYYQHYINAPNHVIAQTLLKASLPLMTSGFVWVLVPMSLVFLLNVRSVMLAYFISFAFIHRNVFLRKKAVRNMLIFGVPLLVIAIVQADWVEVYNRVVFKGRDAAHVGNLVDPAASGRLTIYQFYISYIAENFDMKEWLFGVGPIWIQPGGPALSAHNDALNLFVAFGMLGLLSTLLCYLYLYTKLPGTGRVIFLIAFGALFLTNGVVFHQSNILFVLLYIFFTDKPEINGEGEAKPGCS